MYRLRRRLRVLGALYAGEPQRASLRSSGFAQHIHEIQPIEDLVPVGTQVGYQLSCDLMIFTVFVRNASQGTRLRSTCAAEEGFTQMGLTFARNIEK